MFFHQFYVHILLCVFALTCNQRLAESFIISKNSIVQQQKRTRSILEAEKDSDKEAAGLTFTASCNYTSSPVDLERYDGKRTSSTLHELFHDDKYRNSLFIGSGNIQVGQPSRLKDYKQSLRKKIWSKEAKHFTPWGVQKSNDDIQLLEILLQTPFLAFSINGVGLLGYILTKDGENEELFVINKYHCPEYQFLLFAEDFEAKGPPPLVWIFNQLTGRGNKTKLLPTLSEKSHTFHMFLRVWASESKSMKEEDDIYRIVFKATCTAEINVMFPSMLLKLLPASKDFIESKGNAALLQNMERDVIPGVKKFRDQFANLSEKRS